MNFNKIKADFKKTKEEIFLGGIGGGIMYYVYSHFNNINPLRTMAMESQGIIDKVWTSLPKEDMATLKVMLLFVGIGMILGWIIGRIYNPLTWGK